MSLCIPPMYERTPVYDDRGQHIGYIVRQRGLQLGEVLEPVPNGDGGGFVSAIAIAKEVADNVRYD